ncbi:MAG: hypothetical protein ACYCTL_10350 [Acidimicrobiales bacterium]
MATPHATRQAGTGVDATVVGTVDDGLVVVEEGFTWTWRLASWRGAVSRPVTAHATEVPARATVNAATSVTRLLRRLRRLPGRGELIGGVVLSSGTFGSIGYSRMAGQVRMLEDLIRQLSVCVRRPLVRASEEGPVEA